MKIAFLFSLLVALTLGGCARLQREAPAPVPLTIMSYNIRIGAGPEGPLQTNRLEENMLAIAEYIRSSGADIALLQEVDVGTSRVHGMDQVAFLEEHTGMHAAFGKAIELGGGDYGVALLSRFPISNVEVHKLFKPDYSDADPPRPDWHSEQRVALSALLETPAGPVRVINTHLGITEDQREKQLEDVAELIRAEPAAMAVIFGGDLNAEPGESALKLIHNWLHDGWGSVDPSERESIYTFSATDPNRTIDYLFFSAAFHVKEIEVPRVQLSDHLPVIAQVSIPAP